MNMKPSSKPISSPARADKFPPPLMRFLRTNDASRSRGRSRSSPMFVRKKTTAIDSQEPSSPKVTCMGQVRVRRSSKDQHASAKRNRRNGDTSPTRCSRRCWWLPRALFCRRFSAKIRPSSFHCHCHYQSLRPNCGFFPMFRFRSKRTKVRQDSATSQFNLREKYNGETQHEDFELEEKRFQERVNANANEDVPVPTTTPPENALLLTRCRSAPYRSSSLASRFGGTPLNSEETGEAQKTELQNGQQTDHEKPSSQIESVSDKEGRLDPRAKEELGDLIKGRIIKSENAGDLKREDGGGDSARPLILTRCKSEPARTAQKLDPELNFWKKRKLGVADSCSPHYM